jgi:hypothetical protein
VEQLLRTMVVDSCARDSLPVDFDRDYAGNYGELIAVVKEIVRYNYSSVFSEGGFGLTALK